MVLKNKNEIKILLKGCYPWVFIREFKPKLSELIIKGDCEILIEIFIQSKLLLQNEGYDYEQCLVFWENDFEHLFPQIQQYLRQEEICKLNLHIEQTQPCMYGITKNHKGEIIGIMVLLILGINKEV